MKLQISDELMDKVHNYLGVHADYSQQAHSTARDAYVYHLINLIIGHFGEDDSQ